MLTDYSLFTGDLSDVGKGKKLITTINANSYNIARVDAEFSEALKNSDALLPDGVGIVLAYAWLAGRKIKKIAGADLFRHEMECL